MIAGAEKLKGKKILLVEDDAINIFSLHAALKDYGVNIHDSMTGKDAIEALTTQPFDLVLMDIRLPVMDGLEAISIIRDTPGIRNTPIIAVTAYAMSGDKERCLKTGADDYVSKPIDLHELVRKMIALL